MKQTKLKIILLFLICIVQLKIFAQEAVTASGGNASGAGGSASYSVGQVIYTTNTGTNGSVSQGIQQPFEISIISGIETVEKIQLSCKAYPNPTTNSLKLKIDNKDDKQYSASLFDINGKLLNQTEITNIETIIPMEQYPSQTYILRISDTKQVIKSFQIIKN